MPERESTQIEIAGRTYTIVDDKWSPLYMKNLGQILNEEIKSVEEHTRTVDSYKLMMLAALRIIDKYLQLQEAKSGSSHALEEEIKHLNNLIEEVI